MSFPRLAVLVVLGAFLAAPGARAAAASHVSFRLARAGAATPILVEPGDWPGVARAAGDLREDVARVSGARSPGADPAARAATVVIVGTLGRSARLDRWVAAGRLDVDAIRGRWEAFVVDVVENPEPGIERALVVAGSDKRGTIYGIYEISRAIGVSPWYWWADVAPAHRDEPAWSRGRVVEAGPAVRYRGLFLNDEAPDLTNWVRAKFGDAPVRTNPPVPAGIANYGREFYGRLFEVMLRLRANYLWPAMWNNAFNEDDPDNARLADEYGIVMGTSHQEPMVRAQKEWDRRFQASLGTWNYATHPDVLEQFWREGVRRNRDFESVVTLGLRGANDTEMAPGGPAANRALLEHIVERQRGILRDEVNPELARVPQVWCLYKEVQEYYEHGMRVPDDVTLLWAEDNWGNLRRLPTATERRRSGGAGIYYHFDYHGGPRSYQWLNTSPLPKIWEQMSLAHRYGADRVWIVNAGHFKGYEVPLEFFLDLAWDPARFADGATAPFLRSWAAREFGESDATEIADIVARYAKFNGRRKPELLAPDTYSLTDYREADSVVADYQALAARAQSVADRLPAGLRDAFHELVGFPAIAGALVNELYVAAGRNALYAAQGRASAAGQAERVRSLFADYERLVAHYHGLAGGKWDHFMDQPVLGYTSWRDPPRNKLDHLPLVTPPAAREPGVGVAVEGSREPAGANAALPRFDALNRQRSWFEVFERGEGRTPVTVTPSVPWIRIEPGPSAEARDRHFEVAIDWEQVPLGRATGAIVVQANAAVVTTLSVKAMRSPDLTRATLHGFAEGQGVVAIEPEHFTRSVPAGENRWERIDDYGRTLSGLRAMGPVDAPAAVPGRDSPCLEYALYLFTAGPVTVSASTAPTLNFVPDRGVRYAVSIDDEAPQIVTLVPAGYQAQNRNRAWEQSVANNAHTGNSRHTVAAAGYHTLKIWMIDPAVVLQKIVVDLGGLRPSYLGPPESFHAP